MVKNFSVFLFTHFGARVTNSTSTSPRTQTPGKEKNFRRKILLLCSIIDGGHVECCWMDSGVEAPRLRGVDELEISFQVTKSEILFQPVLFDQPNQDGHGRVFKLFKLPSFWVMNAWSVGSNPMVQGNARVDTSTGSTYLRPYLSCILCTHQCQC